MNQRLKAIYGKFWLWGCFELNGLCQWSLKCGMMFLMLGPSKAERIAQVAILLLGVVGAIAFAAWHPSLFSVLFAVFAAVLITLSLLRSRKIDEKEMMRRQDKAIMATRDDPTEIARWVP